MQTPVIRTPFEVKSDDNILTQLKIIDLITFNFHSKFKSMGKVQKIEISGLAIQKSQHFS